MYNVVKWALSDRRTLFENTASKKGIDVNIVEKDFYVCLLLNYLFEKCEKNEKFLYKKSDIAILHDNIAILHIFNCKS